MASMTSIACASGPRSRSFKCSRAGNSHIAQQRRLAQCAAVKGAAKAPAKGERVVPGPNYTIPGTLTTIATFSAVAHNWGLAAVTGILGVFLAVQANRVQFIFDKEALVRIHHMYSALAEGLILPETATIRMEVVVGKTGAKTDNAFVGGENRWKFDKFVNWEFWWPNFPVLVYFKETQTKPEGQIHFFPIIFDNDVLYQTMKARCGKSKNSA